MLGSLCTNTQDNKGYLRGSFCVPFGTWDNTIKTIQRNNEDILWGSYFGNKEATVILPMEFM